MLQRKMKTRGEPKLQKKKKRKWATGGREQERKARRTRASGAWKPTEAHCGFTGAPNHSLRFLCTWLLDVEP